MHWLQSFKQYRVCMCMYVYVQLWDTEQSRSAPSHSDSAQRTPGQSQERTSALPQCYAEL